MALEMLTLTVTMGSAVLFSGAFIADWSRPRSFVATLLTVLMSSACLIWHRSNYPPNIDPPAPADDSHDDEDDDEGGWWDPFTIILFLVSLVGVIVFGVVARFLLPLMVILLFAVAASGSDVGDVARATLAMLGMCALVEFAIVIPLCKRWNLDFDADPRPRSDFCAGPSE